MAGNTTSMLAHRYAAKTYSRVLIGQGCRTALVSMCRHRLCRFLPWAEVGVAFWRAIDLESCLFAGDLLGRTL